MEWAKGEDLFFVRVRGESMMPNPLDGDYLLMRRQALWRMRHRCRLD